MSRKVICRTDYRNTSCRLLLAWLCLATAALYAQSPPTPVANHYRWVGQSADNKWSNHLNWQLRIGEGWAEAPSPPGPVDVVQLTDAVDDQPQTIRLTRDVMVGSLVMSATGKRTYTLVSETYLPDPTVEQGFVLRLANREAIEQTTAATQDLRFQVTVIGQHDRGMIVRTNSASRARIIVERPMTALGNSLGNGQMYIGGDSEEQGGIVELRQPLIAVRLTQTAGSSILFNGKRDEKLFQFTRGFFAHGGELLFSRDTELQAGISPRGHTVQLRPYNANGEDLLIRAAYISRGGVVRIDNDCDHPAAKLTIALNGIGIGGKDDPPVIHIAENTAIDLGASQATPTLANATDGIHGKGSLVKSRTRREDRSAEHATIIGGRNTYTGGTYIGKGQIKLSSATHPASDHADAPKVKVTGQLGPGMLYIAKAAQFDLDGHNQTVSGLGDMESNFLWPAAAVQLGGGQLTLDVINDTSFAGTIAGSGTILKSGAATQSFTAGYTTPDDCRLIVADGKLRIDEVMNVEAGRFELAGGMVHTDELQSAGQTWQVTLTSRYESNSIVAATAANMQNTKLNVTFAEGYHPAVGTTFTLLSAEQDVGSQAFGLQDKQIIAAGEARLQFVRETTGGGEKIQLVVVTAD